MLPLVGCPALVVAVDLNNAPSGLGLLVLQERVSSEFGVLGLGIDTNKSEGLLLRRWCQLFVRTQNIQHGRFVLALPA
jgi:hypothetical protein